MTGHWVHYCSCGRDDMLPPSDRGGGLRLGIGLAAARTVGDHLLSQSLTVGDDLIHEGSGH